MLIFLHRKTLSVVMCSKIYRKLIELGVELSSPLPPRLAFVQIVHTSDLSSTGDRQKYLKRRVLVKDMNLMYTVDVSSHIQQFVNITVK